ncbi:MAG: glycosyltransferase family 9 protein [Bacteroidota bacterium]|jgi:ADP-heptose:LPS heptosyltransferase
MAKFLIIRFSSMGDIILTTPVVRCIKNQLPDAEIHYLTKPAYRFLPNSNPYVDKVHVINHSLLQTISELKNEKFDGIIDLHNNLRTFICKSLLDAKAYTFNKLNIEKALLTQAGINVMPQLHIVDRYMQAIAALGVVYDGGGLDYFIPEQSEQRFKDSTYFTLTDSPYIAVAIGAQHATKRMPVVKLAEVCKHLSLPVLLLGGNEDATAGEQLAHDCGKHVHNLCGKLSFDESAYIIKHAQHVITHDTGLMHVAAAFNKPMQVIWGNTVPDFGMYPLYARNSKQSASFHEVNVPCRPCSKIGYAACPKSHFKCMMQQDALKIAAGASGNY